MKDKKFYPEDSARFAAAIEKLKGQRVAVLGHQRPDVMQGAFMIRIFFPDRYQLSCSARKITLGEPRDRCSRCVLQSLFIIVLFLEVEIII